MTPSHFTDSRLVGNGTLLQYSCLENPMDGGPGGLQSMGSLRVGHDWMTSLYFSLSCIGEGNGNPLQCSCLENPRDGGAWWAAVYGVAQSRTRLKQLSSSSVYIGWVNKSLLYSTESYIQYPVIKHGQEYEKEHTHRHISITESLCYTPETNITL